MKLKIKAKYFLNLRRMHKLLTCWKTTNRRRKTIVPVRWREQFIQQRHLPLWRIIWCRWLGSSIEYAGDVHCARCRGSLLRFRGGSDDHFCCSSGKQKNQSFFIVQNKTFFTLILSEKQTKIVLRRHPLQQTGNTRNRKECQAVLCKWEKYQNYDCWWHQSDPRPAFASFGGRWRWWRQWRDSFYKKHSKQFLHIIWTNLIPSYRFSNSSVNLSFQKIVNTTVPIVIE